MANLSKSKSPIQSTTNPSEPPQVAKIAAKKGKHATETTATSKQADTGEVGKASAEDATGTTASDRSNAAINVKSESHPAATSVPRPAELIPAKHLSPPEPDHDAQPPGIAPPGDSRSLRRRRDGVEEFVLIYRDAVNIIRRHGIVGKEGKWNCVQYPTLGAAAHAYAQECSELTGQGFHDLGE